MRDAFVGEQGHSRGSQGVGVDVLGIACYNAGETEEPLTSTTAMKLHVQEACPSIARANARLQPLPQPATA